MNAKTAEQLMRCHTGAARECGDPAVRKALVFASGHASLKDKLSAQMEFDARSEAAIAAISLPPHLELQIQTINLPARSSAGLGKVLKQPAVLAVAIALLVMLGWFVYSTLIHSEDFQGREDVLKILDPDKANEMSRSEFDIKSTEAGSMGDLLFSQYGFENYYVPAQLSHLKTARCRVFKQDGYPVAEVSLESHQSLLFVFRADDFGVKITPSEHWRVFEEGDWSLGIQAHGEVCVLIAFKGSRDEMKRFLVSGF